MANWVMARVLHAVRPAPQHLPGLDQGDVGELRLGQQHHVGGGDHLGAGREPGDERCQVVVGVPEALAVPVLEGDPAPKTLVDPRQVVGMEGEPALVLLGGGPDDPEARRCAR
jgi:hypothetical protein